MMPTLAGFGKLRRERAPYIVCRSSQADQLCAEKSDGSRLVMDQSQQRQLLRLL
jgi:hypothetical protein